MTFIKTVTGPSPKRGRAIHQNGDRPVIKTTTWAECHAAGMSAKEASHAMGMTHQTTAYEWAKKHGLKWADKRLAWVAQEVTDRGGPYPEPDLDACQRLWAAVFLESWNAATTEVIGGEGGNSRTHEVAKAQAWIGSEGFRIVCMFCGLDADAVIERYRSKTYAEKQRQQRVKKRGVRA